MMITPERLFVFAGAGISMSMPSGLPSFDQIRNEILDQLDLSRYRPTGTDQDTDEQRAAAGLAPEPFMLELLDNDVEIIGWLNQVLSSESPNAAHLTLAHLACRGANVWTVNFDGNIERAATELEDCDELLVSAVGTDPAGQATLLKPHGTLGSQLILTSRDALNEIPASWRNRLLRDLDGRTVIFVGYSGRDLDFRPLWDTLLAEHAHEVLWFDIVDDNDDWSRREQAYKRALLRRTDQAGKLTLVPNQHGPDQRPNPSFDFIQWCAAQGLWVPAPELVDRLWDRPQPTFPELGGNIERAKPAVQELLGDIRAARSTYLNRLRTGPGRRNAAGHLATLTVHHGGRPVAAALQLGKVIPPLGKLGQARTVCERGRLTVLSKVGDHHKVLRATRSLSADAVSTLLILRSESARVAGSLDEAAALGEQAYHRAHHEGHPVRVAHAAMQWCYALLWAERLDECAVCLDDHAHPHASQAASRWVAWCNIMRGCLFVRRGQADAARDQLEEGRRRFEAEALIDGTISADISMLAVHRQTGDDDRFTDDLNAAAAQLDRRDAGKRFYARGHEFTREAVSLEAAEFARCHTGDLGVAEARYNEVAASRYPLHAGIGHLGVGLVQAQRGDASVAARHALEIGTSIGAQLIVGRALRLIDDPGASGSLAELFFC